MNNDALIATITEAVIREIKQRGGQLAKPAAPLQRRGIPVGISNRHLHLSEADAAMLFGAGNCLTSWKDLSQPGQFACHEKVIIVGPKGAIEGVRVLGPTRNKTQVEISGSDAVRLGIKPPVRDSGDLAGSAGLTLVGPAGTVVLKEGTIIAARHVHMHPDDAARFGVVDRQRISVRSGGLRGVIFQEVLVRVHPQFALDMHVDIDEANAAGLSNGDMVEMIQL